MKRFPFMITKNTPILIIPDVHGRTFWKNAVRGHETHPIVFLGDYLDPYHDPFGLYEPQDDFRPEAVIENFKEILELKRSAPERVTLLLGNHDCEYLYGRNVCDCRCDYANYELIRKLFRENKDLFQLAAETCRGGKHFVFVHAGFSRGWMDRYVKGWTAENMVRELNRLNDEALDAPTPEETSFAEALSLTDRLRGGDAEYASPVWIDALSLHEGPQISEVIQIVGHTAIRGKDLPVLTRNVIYTDCQKGLILGSRGALRYLDGTRCGGKEDPFHPKPNPYENKPFGLDWFERPFCRRCGSHHIYIRAGMFVDHWYCRDCGNDALM